MRKGARLLVVVAAAAAAADATAARGTREPSIRFCVVAVRECTWQQHFLTQDVNDVSCFCTH